MEDFPVIVVGGGLAGLTCANYLCEADKPFLLLEASEKTGGRVKTVIKDGFLLDVGFQVFLNSYEEANKILDLDDLNLQFFKSGSKIFWGGKWHSFINPLKDPLALFSTLMSPVGSFGDKLKLMRLFTESSSEAKALRQENSKTSTIEFLRYKGFSETFIKRFFIPFFGGVFLDKTLGTPANLFQFLFKQFYKGEACLPASGMQAIATQLTENLSPDQVKTGMGVAAIEGQKVILNTGESITADHIVLATDFQTAHELVPLFSWPEQSFNGTINLYYSAPPEFNSGKLLRLVAEPGFIINSLAQMDEIAADYSPNEKHLVSISLLEGEDLPENKLLERVQHELALLFGKDMAQHFHFLHRFDILNALPSYRGDSPIDPRLRKGLILAGDYLQYPSLNGAMLSGRLAAEAVLQA